MEFSTRSNAGIVQDHETLVQALESFISEEGYRLDFFFPDGRILMINRNQYGKDLAPQYIEHPVYQDYSVANSNVLYHDPANDKQDHTNVIYVHFGE